MIRKLLMVAVAAAVPMSAVAVGVVGGGVAGAKTLVPATPEKCAMQGSVNFAFPGISLIGVTTLAKDSTTTSSVSFASCAGSNSITSSVSVLNITTKNTKCTSAQFVANPTPVGTSASTSCAKKRLITDSGGGLGSSTTFKSLAKAVKKGLPLTLHESGDPALVLKIKAINPTEILPGGACGSSEVGFSIPLSVKTSPKSTLPPTGQINVCLGTDGNAGPNNNFFQDLTAGSTIPSTQIDPATSSITVG
jgi:hypothetical protein